MEPAISQDSTGWTETTPEQYVYNIPDAYEQDPEVIRAELMFFNNPESQAFSGEVYYALKNVQDQCQIDYEKFCTQSFLPFGDAQMLMEKLFSSSLPFLMSRRLTEKGEMATPTEHSGRHLLEYLRSFYSPKLNDVKTAAPKKEEKRVRPESNSGVHSHVMRGDNAKLSHALRTSKEHDKPRRLDVEESSAPVVDQSDADVEIVAVIFNSVDMPMTTRERPAPDMMFGMPMIARPYVHEVATEIEPVAVVSEDSVNPLVDPMPAVDMPGSVQGSASGAPPKHPNMPPPPPPHATDDSQSGFRPRPPPGPPGGSPPPPPPGRPGPPPPLPPHGGVEDDEVPHRPPPHDHHPPHHPGDGHDSDSDSDNEGEDEGPHDGRRRHRHSRAHEDNEPLQLNDVYFPGALGYGASGDMCLYDNAQNLSPPCAQAIGDVYALREQYWQSYTAPKEPHHHPFVGLLFVGFVLVVLVKKIMHAPRRRQVHKLLTALKDHPELKAQLESQLNMEIPLPREATCCGGDRRSFGRRLCFAVGYIVFAVVSSVFISITSLEMTAGIVDGMESRRDIDAPPVSPLTVLLILLLIVVAQLVLLRAIMRGAGRLWRRHCGGSASSDDDSDSSPSSSSSSSSDNGGMQVEFRRLASLPVSFYREYVSPRVTSFFAQRAAASEGYAPLQAGDEREMIMVNRPTVVASAPPQVPHQTMVYTGVPVLPQNVVHVSARPVSAVNLV